jgi:hypothetical protein
MGLLVLHYKCGSPLTKLYPYPMALAPALSIKGLVIPKHKYSMHEERATRNSRAMPQQAGCFGVTPFLARVSRPESPGEPAAELSGQVISMS